MTGAIPSATRRLHQSRTRCTVNTLWLVNGSSTGVDPADRGLAYGDGLFETMAAERRTHPLARSASRPARGRVSAVGDSGAVAQPPRGGNRRALPETGPRRRQAHRHARPRHARLSAAGPRHTDARARDFVVARLFRRLLSRRDQRARLSAAARRRILRSQASSTCAASSKCSRNWSFAATPRNKGCCSTRAATSSAARAATYSPSANPCSRRQRWHAAESKG